MILELGLRFRPQATADQEEYSAAVALLARDVADIPENLLDLAITEWVRTKRWLPRAAELIAVAQGIQAERDKPRGGIDLAAQYNQRMDANGTRYDREGRPEVRWIGHGESLRLVHVSELENLRKRGRQRDDDAKYGDAA